MSANSVYRLFRDLPLYRNDIIVYKIDGSHSKLIKQYLRDITNIVNEQGIKMIFCMWSYLSVMQRTKKKIPQTINIINYLNELNLNVKIVTHVHDYFRTLNYYHNLRNIDTFIEIGFIDQIIPFGLPNYKIYPIMHCATSNFIKIFNQNPVNKIFLSGEICDSYKERKKFYNFAIKHLELIDIKGHPGYFKMDLKYPDELNSYICCFYASLSIDELKNNKIILAKAFEIPATGSLLLADQTCQESLSRVGFIENVHCIYTNETDYLEKIKFILDGNNRTKIDEIRKNGQELVLKYHTEKERIVEINQILNSILKD